MIDIDELVDQFHSYLLSEKRVSQNTFSAYCQDMRQLIVFLEKERLSLDYVKPQSLKKFLKKLKDSGLSAKSISRKISTIKLFFDFANNRFGLKNIAAGLVFPKLEKTLPNYLTEQEIKKLLGAANNDSSHKGIRNKVMLYLLYASGMRVSELVGLTTDQIHFDTGFLHLIGKGNKERVIPLPKNILELLKSYLENVHRQLLPEKVVGVSVKNYLFPSVYGSRVKPISRQLFWQILKKILSTATIFKNVSPHSLRHSLATHLLKNGADIRSLQMLLGHENLATVQVYTHLGTAQVRKIYDKKHPRA